MYLSEIDYGSDDFVYNDGTIIRKIYVYNMSADVNEAKLRLIFTRFGAIENISIENKGDLLLSGFITFVNSKDAEKALKDENCYAEPAFPWHQPPSANKSHEVQTRVEEEDFVINEKESLLVLNNDCLLHIFSYLNLFELEIVEAVCKHFAHLANLIYKNYFALDFNTIKEGEYITLVESRSVLKRVGQYVTKFKIENHRDKCFLPCFHFRIIEWIPKYCIHLKWLKLENILIYKAALKKFQTLFKQLEALMIISCRVDDDIGEILETTDCLKTFYLTENTKITGHCLTKLKNLNILSLYACPNIKPDYFLEFCKNNKTLTDLNLSFCESLTGSGSINAIVKYLPNLKKLTINNKYKADDALELCKLGQLENFKMLTIDISHMTLQNFDLLLNELAIRDEMVCIELEGVEITEKTINILGKFTKLKGFEFYSKELTDKQICEIVKRGELNYLRLKFCKMITNAGLINVVKLCPYLKTLIIMGCSNIDNNFFKKLPEIQRNDPRRSEKIAVLYIGNVKIEENSAWKPMILPDPVFD